MIKLKGNYFFVTISDGEAKVTSINSDKAETKFVLLQDKLDSLIKTTGFKVCSGIISRDYIIECLQYSEYFIISLGMHKKETKLQQKLKSEPPLKKLSNISAYDCLGFVFLERYKKSKISLYLNAICSNKGFGDKMLSLSEYLAEFMYYKKMYLSAVDTALPYYISRKYEIIINRKSGKNLKYIIDSSNRRSIQKPISGSKELYVFRGSTMYRSLKQNKRNSNLSARTNLTASLRRSSRTKKRQNNNSGPKQYILQNVSFDSDDNINMVKELSIFIS